MTDKQFSIFWGEALSVADRDAFISDAALSSAWDDTASTEISADRVNQLGQIWDVAHLTIKDIRTAIGLSQAAFAQHFCIPCRSIENWESGVSACPDYLRLLLAQATGLYERDTL